MAYRPCFQQNSAPKIPWPLGGLLKQLYEVCICLLKQYPVLSRKVCFITKLEFNYISSFQTTGVVLRHRNNNPLWLLLWFRSQTRNPYSFATSVCLYFTTLLHSFVQFSMEIYIDNLHKKKEKHFFIYCRKQISRGTGSGHRRHFHLQLPHSIGLSKCNKQLSYTHPFRYCFLPLVYCNILKIAKSSYFFYRYPPCLKLFSLTVSISRSGS